MLRSAEGPLDVPLRADQVDKMVARNIRAWRIERTFTLTTMVELIGVTYQMLQKYENGHCRVSAGRLLADRQSSRYPNPGLVRRRDLRD
jgi:transcriptional regulator with XRE-family HTH domain